MSLVLDLVSSANCRDLDTDLFFEEEMHPAVRAACSTCVVAQQCLDVALANEGAADKLMRFGVVAGTTPSVRESIYRGYRDAVPFAPSRRQPPSQEKLRAQWRAAQQRRTERKRAAATLEQH